MAGVAPARHANTGWPARFFLPLSTRWFSVPLQAAQPVAVHWPAGQPSQRSHTAAGAPAAVVTSGLAAR